MSYDNPDVRQESRGLVEARRALRLSKRIPTDDDRPRRRRVPTRVLPGQLSIFDVLPPGERRRWTARPIDEIQHRTGAKRSVLVEVLEQELALGRVRRDDHGRYEIVPDRFPCEALEALRQLRPLDAEDRSLAARHVDGRRRRVALVTGGFRPSERAAIERPFSNGVTVNLREASAA